ncbi:8568_t:CDS:1 [Paraglomus brasilianum]|uniref:Threonylcarbamoyl-AMP synthase n=1 Tax=Paraglomus brasilianum TaxID=144538 RepID=A0A9N9H4B1_9GLOM|nr:8568_t:CDS:1 [Paraglomus brasilianum]
MYHFRQYIFLRPTSTVRAFHQIVSNTLISENSSSPFKLPPRKSTMKTKLVSIDPNSFSFVDGLEDPTFTTTDPNAEKILSKAALLLKNNQVVAIPTETVYGLAANALNTRGILQIYATKNRPADNPLIVHVSSLKMLRSLLMNEEIPQIYHSVIHKFWPGPLTILFPKSSLIPSEITCNQETVAIRFPSHPIARALISVCKFPLAAPSANVSGRPSPTLASHVMDDLNGKIPMIIDGGQCSFGVESTVLDGLHVHGPVILRPGGVTYEALISIPEMSGLRVYKKDFVDKDLEATPTTPGMKYRHYSPNAQVILLEGNDVHNIRKLVESEVANAVKSGNKKIGILRTTGVSDVQGECHTQEVGNGIEDMDNVTTSHETIEYILGNAERPQQVAQELFKGLRYLDEQKADCIIVEGVSEAYEGLAVMNRLRKAATRIVT